MRRGHRVYPGPVDGITIGSRNHCLVRFYQWSIPHLLFPDYYYYFIIIITAIIIIIIITWKGRRKADGISAMDSYREYLERVACRGLYLWSWLQHEIHGIIIIIFFSVCRSVTNVLTPGHLAAPLNSLRTFNKLEILNKSIFNICNTFIL